MTGREQDPEALFREIGEKELLADRYREARRAKYREDEKKQKKRGAFGRKIRKASSLAKYLYRRYLAPKRVRPEWDLDLSGPIPKERRELYIRPERIAVYTALYGAYDVIRDPLFLPENVDYYLLTDQPFPKSGPWMRCGHETALPAEIRRDPVLCNRWCKMHPHLLFPDYAYSIYIDANIWVLSDLTPAAAGLDRYPVAMFRHKKRDCVYEEVQACIDQKKADPELLRKQEEALRSLGIPAHWGLLEASVIARKHHDSRCTALMDAWWEAFAGSPRRDQISLIGCLWQAGISPARIGTLGRNLQRCRLFIQLPHPSSGGPVQPRDPEELERFLSASVTRTGTSAPPV